MKSFKNLSLFLSIIVILIMVGFLGVWYIPLFLLIFFYSKIPIQILAPVKFLGIVLGIIFIVSPWLATIFILPFYTPPEWMSIRYIIIGAFLYLLVFQIDFAYIKTEIRPKLNLYFQLPKEDKEGKVTLITQVVLGSLFLINKMCNSFLITLVYFVIPLVIAWLQAQIATYNTKVEQHFNNYLNALYFLALPLTLFIWQHRGSQNKKNDEPIPETTEESIDEPIAPPVDESLSDILDEIVDDFIEDSTPEPIEDIVNEMIEDFTDESQDESDNKNPKD